ncbi:MAG TPA: hypothetical protein VG167_02610 [Verrucomicrobiae bacterium]|nr:hypothetical protein [Verrucomicrobiae bacterium]
MIRSYKLLVFFSAFLGLSAFWLTGCGKRPVAGLSTSDQAAFNQAPPQVKQIWDTAVASDRTNNYAAAQELYYALLRESLDPAEHDAVVKASTAVNERLMAGVEKGDPAALAALKELRAHPPNRPMR